MMSLKIGIATAVLLSGIGLAASPAGACTCNVQGPGFRYPEELPQQLSTTSDIFLDPDGELLTEPVVHAQFELTDSSGAPVPFVEADVGGLLRLRPMSAWPPGEMTLHELFEVGPEGSYIDPQFELRPLLATLTIEQTDVPQPDVPSVAQINANTGLDMLPLIGPIFSAGCGGGTIHSLITLETAAPIVVATYDEPPSEPTSIASAVIDKFSFNEHLPLGRLPCSGAGPAPVPLGRQSVRVGSFNLESEFSGWSEPIAIVYPLPGCRCGQHQPSSSTPFAAFLFVFLAALRTRRPIVYCRKAPPGYCSSA